MKIITKMLMIASIAGVLSSVSYAIALIPGQIVPGQMIPSSGPITGYNIPSTSAPAQYLKVENYNTLPISVEFNSYIGGMCMPFGPGILSTYKVQANQYIYSNFLYTRPEHLCVHVEGHSSIFGVGGWTPVNNNSNCVITVRDNGLLHGVNLTYSPPCMVDGVAATAKR